MSKITARNRLLNQDRIMIMRRNISWWNFPFYLLYRMVPFTDHRNSFWKPFSLYNYIAWEKEQELNRLADKALKVGAELVEANSLIKVEVKKIKETRGNDYHYGVPYQLDTKLINTRGTLADPPGKEYTKVFKPHVYGGKEQRGSVGGRIRNNSNPKFNPERSAIIPKDFSQWSLAIENDKEFDRVDYVTSDEGHKNQGKKKKGDTHWSNRVKGESDEEYERRKELQLSPKEYYV